MTQYDAATPSCPVGWGGTAPSPSLARPDVAHGYAFTSLRSVGSWKSAWMEADGLTSRLVVPSRIWGCGAPGAPGRSTGPARPTSPTPF